MEQQLSWTQVTQRKVRASVGLCVCMEDRKKEDVVTEWAFSGVDSYSICMQTGCHVQQLLDSFGRYSGE